MIYYVNRNSQFNGDHEVHTTNCSWLQKVTDKAYLGDFSNCQPAVKQAEILGYNANGCAYCCSTCHTQ